VSEGPVENSFSLKDLATLRPVETNSQNSANYYGKRQLCNYNSTIQKRGRRKNLIGG
jgi:hypothetical protein